MNLAIIAILCSVIVILAVVYKKVDRNNTENYCVDITGGFKPPCDCGGYRETN